MGVTTQSMSLLFDESALDSRHNCGYRQAYEALKDLFRDELAELKVQFQSEISELQNKVNELQAKHTARRSESNPHKKPKPELSEQEKAEKRRKSDEKRRESRNKRKSLPDSHYHVELPSDQRRCLGCDKDMKSWKKHATSTVYVFIPGHFEKRVYHREVLSCDKCSFIVKAPPPKRPFQGGQQFDAGLVADVVVAKCANATPLYRIRKAYRRQNMVISESSLQRLFKEAGLHLKVVWQRIHEIVASQELVQADETPVKMTQHKDRKEGQCKTGFMWAFLAPDIDAFAFVYSASRSRETPVKILGASKGTLVVDGYAGYNSVTTPETRQRVGCNIHARRKFLALKNTYKKEAEAAREFYNRLYRIEHLAKDRGILGTVEHLKLRQTQSAPIMAELKTWLEKTKKGQLRKSSLTKAINYTLNQWGPLTEFLKDAKLPLDNNRSEQRMRHMALGRKNWLFFGNEEAGQLSAVLHTLVLNCEPHGVNPQDYLTDLVMQDPAELRENVDAYLPWNWKPPDGYRPGHYPLFSEEYLVTEVSEPPQ